MIRHFPVFDKEIAAIVSAARASVATGKLSDHEGCGIKVLNAWDA